MTATAPRQVRLPDALVAAVALACVALPLLAAGVLLWLTGMRAVLYRQERVGRYGHVFRLYKLRTMRPRPVQGPSITVAHDTRVTRLGAVLRRWKIDELPQLVNVLRGDMRLIGPRPEVERFTSVYTPEQRTVLAYQPGLASLSQLMYPHEADLLGSSSDPERAYIRDLLPRKVAVDIAYERQRTWRSDVALVVDLLLMIAGWSRRKDTTIRIVDGDPLLTPRVASRP